jgi:hypothetical protein
MRETLIITKDRVGLLAEISYVLGKEDINIEAISADTVGKKAIIHLVTSDYKKAEELLRGAGFSVMHSDIIVISLEERPGELSKVAKILADSQVNIKNVQLLTKEENKAMYAIRVDKIKKAVGLLREYL